MTLLWSLLTSAAPALAAGGAGGAGATGAGTGGAGGADFLGAGAGGNGTAGTANVGGGGGGGGGGSGQIGGPGAAGSGGAAGGQGSTSIGLPGDVGTAGAAAGDGGGGGGGGTGVPLTGSNLTTVGNFTASAGGAGGAGNGTGGGGGGGAGGAEDVFLDNLTFTVTGGFQRRGGAGGAGGASSTGFGGVGGSGGVGADFLAGGSLIVRVGSLLRGGNGGAGGVGGAGNGADGAGGVGVTGANISIVNTGTLAGGMSGGTSAIQADAIALTGGTNSLTLSSGGTVGTLTGGIGVSGALAIDPGTTAGNSVTLGNVIHDGTNGAGNLVKSGAGTLIVTGNNSYTGGTTVAAGILQMSASGTLGAAAGSTTISGGTLDLGGTTQTQATWNLAGGILQNGSLNAPIISSGGTINDLGGSTSLTTTSGTTVVTGTNTYSGATTVNGGVLDVIGSISDPTVNAGGTLTGTGSVGDSQINAGGIFAPGNGTAGTSMTIAGNLAFASGAIYLVQINPSTASFATVTGTATLGGATVNAAFASGSYIAKRYTILTASGGVSGTFASNVVNTSLPANFSTSLSYDAHNAYLNLILDFGIPGGLNDNQRAVGNALTNFFNATGGIAAVYSALTPGQLTQASGELGTSSQQTTFNAMGQFMGLLTDPFMQRSGGAGFTPGASGFAEESEASGYAARKRSDAFAMFAKAPPAPFAQRWSVWAAGFGGSQSTDGNAAVGSNNTTSSVYGTAVGADYLFSPNTIAGFALAGGGTSFSVNGLGSGRSDLFQAGAYVRHNNGPAYISAAIAYGWQDITTDRTVTIAGADRLRAEFNANAYSGRLEGGYRFVGPWIGGVGLTPYGAAQFTTFDLPAYAEQVLSGSSAFALSYATKSVTDTRSELGVRSDKPFAMPDGVLTLRGRAAWAHDFNPDRAIAASFQTLPGASFVVNGAAQAHDSALTTASAEMKWMNGWSAGATFEGEFSNMTRSYAGKGTVRYEW